MQSMSIAGPLDADLSNANPVRQWVASLHFVTATVTTVGYGKPISDVPTHSAPWIDQFNIWG